MPHPTPFDRMLLRKRRRRCAASITAHDFLLHRVADDLMDRLASVSREFDVTVSLNGHHGVVGSAMRQMKNVGLVVEADVCEAFVKAVDRPGLVCDEEALPFANGRIDLIASGLSLHFVNDLPGTLVQIRRTLKPDGLFLAALLGGRTLWELRDAFLEAETEILGGVSPRVAPMIDVRESGALLQRAGFALPVTDADLVTVTYSSPLALMHELRGMGAGNVLSERSRKPLRREILWRACEIYQNHHERAGRVPASFEIIYLTGWSPHESQQKPLRPGAAQMRLADALGTSEHKLLGPHQRLSRRRSGGDEF